MNKQRSYRYRVVDVFSRQPLEGNPLAVFPEATDLDDSTMQRIARELNLSETVFLFPASGPEAAAALRIFSPKQELPFAGHPTVGACFVLLDEGIVGAETESFRVEEKVGLITIRVERNDGLLIWLTTPPITYGGAYDRSLCAEVLGLPPDDLLEIAPQVLSAGNPTLFVALRSQAAVDRAWIDLAGLSALKNGRQEPLCVFVFTPTSSGAYSRMFAPEYGIAEDPATGSSTGPLAEFMMRHKLVAGEPGTRFVSEQGVKMHRRSILHIQIHGDRGANGIAVGGHVSPIVDAVLRL